MEKKEGWDREKRHPTKDIIGSKSSQLEGKTIVLCMTGSVAVINAPALARELMRHGAEVITVMSTEACDLIQPELMEWATGNEVVTDITGKIEHIFLAGEREGEKGLADVVVVYPATSNTLAKIAYGIADTPVTTVCTVAIGSKTPLIVVPAMHDSMYRSPIVRENIERLRKFGISVLSPRLEENKAKIASVEDVRDLILNILSQKQDLKGLRFLVTAGPSREMIDRVRFISNPSSGKMGMAFAEEIIARGGQVTVLCGTFAVPPPPGSDVIHVKSVQDFVEAMKKELSEKHYDVLISAAALADFQPIQKEERKISSEIDALTIKLKPTPKLIKEARKVSKDLFIVAFKAETDLDSEQLKKKAYDRMISSDVNMIVANNVNEENKGRGFASDTNEVLVIDRENVVHIPLSSKRVVASKILDIVLKNLKAQQN